MRFNRRSDSPLKKKARRGFRGYPVATIAFYGPNDENASKVAVAILAKEDAGPDVLERWFGKTSISGQIQPSRTRFLNSSNITGPSRW